MTIFLNGKQKRVKRPPTIDGINADEFVRRNADQIWLHQTEMWEYMDNFQEEFGTVKEGQRLVNEVDQKIT